MTSTEILTLINGTRSSQKTLIANEITVRYMNRYYYAKPDQPLIKTSIREHWISQEVKIHNSQDPMLDRVRRLDMIHEHIQDTGTTRLIKRCKNRSLKTILNNASFPT